MRLDLDKQAFLDHFEEASEEEQILRRAAPRLISLLYAELDKRDGLSPDESYVPAALGLGAMTAGHEVIPAARFHLSCGRFGAGSPSQVRVAGP